MAPASRPLPDWLYSGAIGHTVIGRNSTSLEESPHSAQLILTSPPDLSESTYSEWPQLFEMYEAVFGRSIKALKVGGVLCVVITDRKWKGQIVRKHESVTAIADRLDMRLFAHKILIRTQKIDLYRLGFSHILCFRNRTESQSRTEVYRLPQFTRDIWGPFDKLSQLPYQRNSFAPEAIQILITAFTKRGDVVLDPFCGTGVTQRVALGVHRKARGYEIDPKMQSFWGELKTGNRSAI